jgi:hypothetical protein
VVWGEVVKIISVRGWGSFSSHTRFEVGDDSKIRF